MTARETTGDLAVEVTVEAVIAVETAEEIAEADSVVEAGAAEEIVRMAAICLLQNMLHPVRRARRIRLRDHLCRETIRASLLRLLKGCHRSFCPANRSPNTENVRRLAQVRRA
jgi:hypothetical protein